VDRLPGPICTHKSHRKTAIKTYTNTSYTTISKDIYRLSCTYELSTTKEKNSKKKKTPTVNSAYSDTIRMQLFTIKYSTILD